MAENKKATGIIRNITEYSDPLLDVFIHLNEIQLKTINEPNLGIFIAESSKVIERALNAGFEPITLLVDEKISESEDAERIISRCPAAFTLSKDVLNQIAGSELTGGMLCSMKRKALPDANNLCERARRIAILEHVTNPTNVGAIIRSAAAMNIDAVLLTTNCSDPLYRRAARVSMGTVFQIPWAIIDNALCVRDFGFKTAALALTDDSVSIDDSRLKTEKKLAIILGSEGYGLAPETIASSDYVVKIPMRDCVDSLNVAAASAVAFWEIGAANSF